MKHVIYGIAGVLAISTALPAFATSATATTTAPMQARTTEVVETASSRTVIVSESTLFGQQIAAELEGVEKASTFRNWVAANGLSLSLRDDEDGYTAFVPVNDGLANTTFAAPAQGKFNPQARSVLEDHIVDSKFDVNLLHGTRDRVTSLSGKTITISKAGKNYYANGHLIVDRKHSPEGIIYFIDSPLESSAMRSAIYNPADVKK